MSKIRNMLKENHEEYITDKESLDYAEDAIKDLERRSDASRISKRGEDTFPGKGIKIIGKGVTDRYIKHGGIDFLGEKIDNPRKLAELLQGYRNPLFETMRIFYIKENHLIGVEGVSNHLPGICSFPFRGIQEYVSHINNNMENLKADNFYIVHNHPTGNPTPSFTDISFTLGISKAKGYSGHIVLDHTKFCLIDHNGDYQELDVPNHMVKDIFMQADIEHPLINKELRSPSAIAEVGRKLSDTEATTDVSFLLFLAGDGRLRMIQEVSNSCFDLDISVLLKESLLNSGSAIALCVTSNEDIYANTDQLIKQGYMFDMIFIDPDYPFYWNKQRRSLSIMKLMTREN